MKTFFKKTSIDIQSDISALRKDLASVSGEIESVIRGADAPEVAGGKVAKLRAKADVLTARIATKEADLKQAVVSEAKAAFAEAEKAYNAARVKLDAAKVSHLADLMRSHEITAARRLCKSKNLWPISMQEIRLQKRQALERLEAAGHRLIALGVTDAPPPARDAVDE